MKKVNLNAGDTVTFSFEILVSIEKDCALNYIRSIAKNKKEYEFDDGQDY